MSVYYSAAAMDTPERPIKVAIDSGVVWLTLREGDLMGIMYFFSEDPTYLSSPVEIPDATRCPTCGHVQ